MKMTNIPEIFATQVFTPKIMKEKMGELAYNELQNVTEKGMPLTTELADKVAAAMKEWAIEMGATHYTHWFQPLTGITAEKHDSFISPAKNGDGIIMEFSGKELIKGETDGSSFPSGGLRATFEARGYTAWDPTSYALIRDDSLYIPTAFCSYTGEALDKKTPLLRSMEALNIQALRILKLFGRNDAKHVTATVGAEQEYFLLDRSLWNKRKDLVYCGRTLFGAKPPKGQELSDHYFGSIRPRVAAYMKDLDKELWKLGIMSKTKHNEVAPCQHELAPVFCVTNIATDHNQLTMEVMKKVAEKHGLVCLLAEKPFAGVNGSGKHNNWSMSTDTGYNLLEPSKDPYASAQFITILCAVIKAVDDYQDILRASVATAGNDHRLGANEAPPAIISVFLGDELTAILQALENDTPYNKKEKTILELGVHSLPSFPKDTTDRNRTSPFAFTGNKFEFRMVGSSASIADANTVINTIVAESLRVFADELEAAEDFRPCLNALIKRTIKEHKRIIFNGNNYSSDWEKEAEKRGLLNLRSTPEAIAHLTDEKNVELFARHKVFTKNELISRQEIVLENYCKILNIEALTMLEMVRKEILPATLSYIKNLCDIIKVKLSVATELPVSFESHLVAKLSNLCESLDKKADTLDKVLEDAHKLADRKKCATAYRQEVFATMQEMRAIADELETLVGEKYWPYPTYGELLFYN